MKAKEFKSNLKAIKNQLKGLTIQFIQPNSVAPHSTLMSFGNAILDAESYFNSFSIGHVWTENGLVYPRSFNELKKLLKSAVVTGVSFSARNVSSDFGESMRLAGGLD
jgi:hypothetical protein